MRAIEQQVSAIREFNRFYTARLGLLRRRHLDGEFSLTEARTLYEIGSSPSMTASDLRRRLELDAGYISRLLSALTRRKLIRQSSSGRDGRERLLTLTASGKRKVARLNEQSARQIRQLLSSLNESERNTLVRSLTTVRGLLRNHPHTAVRIERLAELNEAALQLLNEYYEAVHVVQRDKPQAVRRLMADDSSGFWMAYLDDKPAGCVVLRRLASIPHAGECKRLYVRPEARGRGIAENLMDALEAFAWHQGMRWIYLDSYDDLKAAIGLYRKRGYVECERYNDNPQATVFLRKELKTLN
jgi:DNA-binding MarR family transcriptional regulator/GNAT superfamily N-acetyltransferase